MPTPTTVYSFNKPTVGGDTDVWGGFLNDNWDDVDDYLSGALQVSGMDIANASVNANVLTLNGEVVETVFNLTSTSNAATLEPNNGTIQLFDMTENATLTDALANGESMLLGITDGTGFTITWPTMEWIGGSAPVLSLANRTWVTVWKAGGTLYGAFVGISS